jgi:hypothetical protein
MRRTKAALIYRRTKNLRAVQLLRGHSKLESTVRYLGIEVTTPLRWPSKWKSERVCRWAADHSVVHRPRPGTGGTKMTAEKRPLVASGRLSEWENADLLR